MDAETGNRIDTETGIVLDSSVESHNSIAPTSVAIPRRSLTAADITALPSLESLYIPELDGIVYLQPPNALDMLEDAEKVREGNSEAIARLIAMCVVDESRTRLFDHDSATSLLRIRVDVFNRLAAAAIRVAMPGAGVDEEKKD